jgi:hypothetical protein
MKRNFKQTNMDRSMAQRRNVACTEPKRCPCRQENVRSSFREGSEHTASNGIPSEGWACDMHVGHRHAFPAVRKKIEPPVKTLKIDWLTSHGAVSAVGMRTLLPNIHHHRKKTAKAAPTVLHTRLFRAVHKATNAIEGGSECDNNSPNFFRLQGKTQQLKHAIGRDPVGGPR